MIIIFRFLILSLVVYLCSGGCILKKSSNIIVDSYYYSDTINTKDSSSMLIIDINRLDKGHIIKSDLRITINNSTVLNPDSSGVLVFESLHNQWYSSISIASFDLGDDFNIDIKNLEIKKGKSIKLNCFLGTYYDE
ncbi:MAG: hypothetical protein Kapaf2KO_00970 [Candidatus Kapaibacteriales bacterium]